MRHLRRIRSRQDRRRPYRLRGTYSPCFQRQSRNRPRARTRHAARAGLPPGSSRHGAYHGRCRFSPGFAFSRAFCRCLRARATRRRVPRLPAIPGIPVSRHQAYRSGPGPCDARRPGEPAARHQARRSRPSRRRTRGWPPPVPPPPPPVRLLGRRRQPSRRNRPRRPAAGRRPVPGRRPAPPRARGPLPAARRCQLEGRNRLRRRDPAPRDLVLFRPKPRDPGREPPESPRDRRKAAGRRRRVPRRPPVPLREAPEPPESLRREPFRRPESAGPPERRRAPARPKTLP